MSSDTQERRAAVRLFWWFVWIVLRVYAVTRPKVVIHLNGSPYMTRWFLTCTPPTDARGVFTETGTPGWYLHRIHRPDADRRLHNHPWKRATSWILRGGYIEIREGHPGEHLRHERRPGDRVGLAGQTFHRVASVFDPCYTLFRSGPKHGRGWGFRDGGTR
jgi:hypothetical protein